MAVKHNTGRAETPGNVPEALSSTLGKRARLWRLLYGSGPGNGTLLILPLDHGLEHGPSDFFPHPPALDPSHGCRIAAEGRCSAIVLGIGLAEKYMRDFAGRVPLVLKLNGKTSIPGDAEAVSPLTGSVRDAVRLGADAVGYTLYVGSPRQDSEIAQFAKVREECDRLGMPIVMWAYPRGRDIEAKGGKGTLYAQDYAARVALELGADVVKLHEPVEDDTRSPEPYPSLKETAGERVRRVVRSAGHSLVLFAGGQKDEDDERVLRKIKLYMDGGARGLMVGRNIWLRPYEEALAMTRRIHALLARYPQ